MKNKIIYNGLPKIIITLLLNSQGWLVGSAVKSILEKNVPKDYDIIIPNRDLYYSTIRFLLLENSEYFINTFGGFKFKKNDIEIDIWCEELGHFMFNCKKIDYIYSPYKNLLLEIT